MFRFSRISRCTRTNRKYFYRQRCLVLVAGQNGRQVDAASPVVSRDKVNSSCNHFWRKRWPREPLQVPRATRTRSFDPYWSISSTVRRCSDSPKKCWRKIRLRLAPPLTGLWNDVDKWNQQGEHQPAVGVLLLTRGVDGDESTSL